MQQLLIFILSGLLSAGAIAQIPELSITTDKTTTLVFPYSISNVDRGTNDILAKQFSETHNVLLVKAAAKNFPETNLTVATADGSVYTFTVHYRDNPDTLLYHVPAMAIASIQTYAKSILDNPSVVKSKSDIKGKAEIRLFGIYTKGNTTYYQVRLQNKSAIDYDISLVRFFVKDRSVQKRTAIQEVELKPIFIAGNDKAIPAFQNTMIVVALERFTIPDKKFLGIQIMEKNGGRHLQMKVGNQKIINAILLPDLK